MPYFYPAQQGHLVNICPPIDLNDAAKTCDAFSMEGYSHASIIILLGTAGTASTVTVEECTTAAGAGNTAIAFSYHATTDTATDTLGARTTVASTGLAMTAVGDAMVVIEIDASQLSEGYPWVQVQFTDPGGAQLGAAVAVLSGGRYASDQSGTAIA